MGCRASETTAPTLMKQSGIDGPGSKKIQHAADLPIWENMAYIGNPPYVFDEVGIFRAFRKWAMPHYEDVPVDESLARL
jgi:hypothetical protein